MMGDEFEEFIAQLHFPEIVCEEFDFLIKDYGFTWASQGNIGVRYESPPVWVRVFYDPREGFIVVRLGLMSDRNANWSDLTYVERGVSLAAVIELHEPKPEIPFFSVRASTAAEVRTVVSKLAALLQQYGENALRGDPETFARLQTLIEEREKHARDQYQKELDAAKQSRAVRQQCEHLWRHGRLDEARIQAEDALRLAKEGGVSFDIGFAHLSFAQVEYVSGHVEQARFHAKWAQRRFAKYTRMRTEIDDHLPIREGIEEVEALQEALTHSPHDPSAYIARFQGKSEYT